MQAQTCSLSPHDARRGRIGDFLDALAADHDPHVTGEEALKVQRLIDALIQAGETGQPVAVATG